MYLRDGRKLGEKWSVMNDPLSQLASLSMLTSVLYSIARPRQDSHGGATLKAGGLVTTCDLLY